jgi:hydroxymethylpyrimidine kinase/phosphomethylpyrimidine kinase/thiamine-phosphate diphosphorylase
MNRELEDSKQPVAWTIGGSDSSGGAGVQSDLKTMLALSVHGCSVITAVTAQNTKGVNFIEPVSPAILYQQLCSLNDDLKPKAIKLGMLYSREIIAVVADFLEQTECFVVCDPVMVATSGDSLLQEHSLELLKNRILPRVDLVTPNLFEAKVLTRNFTSAYLPGAKELSIEEEIEMQAEQILALGPKRVLIKGGHSSGPFCQDCLVDRHSRWWLTSPRQNSGEVHGTGCTLSAAITASVASGHSLLDSVVIAKAYVSREIKQATSLGSGSKILVHSKTRFEQADLPSLTPDGIVDRHRLTFPEAEEIGLYAVLPGVKSLRRAINAGIKTAQLRIKDLSPEGFKPSDEIRHGIELAKSAGCRLYINDHWQDAIKFGAYGVHLGQEDIKEADLEAIAAAGLRLGISTHCYSEVSRALAINPSYIAVGPIFPTTTKQMKFEPHGIKGFKFWRDIINFPLVAIGGIFLSNASQLLQAGADGIAVVRALEESQDYDADVLTWHELLATFGFNNLSDASPFASKSHDAPIRVS